MDPSSLVQIPMSSPSLPMADPMLDQNQQQHQDNQEQQQQHMAELTDISMVQMAQMAQIPVMPMTLPSPGIPYEGAINVSGSALVTPSLSQPGRKRTRLSEMTEEERQELQRRDEERKKKLSELTPAAVRAALEKRPEFFKHFMEHAHDGTVAVCRQCGNEVAFARTDYNRDKAGVRFHGLKKHLENKHGIPVAMPTTPSGSSSLVPNHIQISPSPLDSFASDVLQTKKEEVETPSAGFFQGFSSSPGGQYDSTIAAAAAAAAAVAAAAASSSSSSDSPSQSNMSDSALFERLQQAAEGQQSQGSGAAAAATAAAAAAAAAAANGQGAAQTFRTVNLNYQLLVPTPLAVAQASGRTLLHSLVFSAVQALNSEQNYDAAFVIQQSYDELTKQPAAQPQIRPKRK